MAIENHDAFCAELCVCLDIPRITLLVTMHDDEIRRRCNNTELVTLVIELKQKTLERVAETLA